MTFETLLVDVATDGVAVVTVNRPDKLNALDRRTLDELDTCFSALAEDTRVRGVILTGAGEKSFVAGADISQFTRLDARTATAFARHGQSVFDRIERLGKPVIAAVNGFALGGGCELALACHLRVASENARFGQPEVGLGLLPGYGGTQRLPRIVGRGIALELILTGSHIPASRAYEIGLVNRVVAADRLMDETRSLLQSILKQAPIAVELSIDAVMNADLPLEQGLAVEALAFGQAFATEDLREGVTAFLERRKPVFRGC